MSSAADWAAFDRPEVRAGFAAESARGCEVMIALDGMHCANCAARAERLLAGQADSIRVNVAARTVSFRFQPARTALSGLLGQLAEAGLQPRILADESAAKAAAGERRWALARIGVATICAMQVMMLAWPSYFGVHPEPGIAQLLRWAQLVVATPGVLWAGWPFFSGAWRSLLGRSLDMNVPVAIALASAFAASGWRTVSGGGDLYFDTATMFVWFLLVGRHLEGMTRQQAARHLRLLAGRRALTACRRAPEGLETVAIGALRIGDVVVVAPGDKLPADGELLDQAADVDEALLTGEAMPVLHRPGDAVLAGAINAGSAPLALRVSRLGQDTRLAQIATLLNQAMGSKPRLQKMTDRIAAHFVFGVLVFAAAGAGFALWRGQPADAALSIALAVLVASCPCALSLAVPAALAAATSRLARAGLLVANPDALEALRGVDTVLFDKTGTLTLPKMHLARLQTLGSLQRQECLDIAASLEQGSRHPIAAAFGDGHPRAVQDLRYHAGAGIAGRIDGRSYWLGAPEHAPVQAGQPILLPEGTWIQLCRDDAPVAMFCITAGLRPEAPALVAALGRRGLQLELRSGDAVKAVFAVADRLGIENFAGRQSPADKLTHLSALQQQGHRVLAVGDGLNDAPLLAAADVSAAMAHGADLTQGCADLLLLGDSLAPLAQALDSAQTVALRIRENLYWALGYNLLVLPLAISGHLPPWMAAAGMSLSSLLVVANALRGHSQAQSVPKGAAQTSLEAC